MYRVKHFISIRFDEAIDIEVGKLSGSDLGSDWFAPGRELRFNTRFVKAL